MSLRLNNIPLKKVRKALKFIGCNIIRTNGGHETWAKTGLTRPIILQSHIDPVPRRIMKQIINDLSESDCNSFLKSIN